MTSSLLSTNTCFLILMPSVLFAVQRVFDMLARLRFAAMLRRRAVPKRYMLTARWRRAKICLSSLRAARAAVMLCCLLRAHDMNHATLIARCAIAARIRKCLRHVAARRRYAVMLMPRHDKRPAMRVKALPWRYARRRFSLSLSIRHARGARRCLRAMPPKIALFIFARYALADLAFRQFIHKERYLPLADYYRAARAR